MPLAPPPIVKALQQPRLPPPYPYYVGAAAQPENTIRVSIQQPTVPVEESGLSSGPGITTIIISLVLGIVLLVLGLFLALRKLRQSVVVDATLSNVQCNESVCIADLTFKDQNGKLITVVRHKIRGFSYRNGQTVSVRYDPANPGNVSINFLPYLSKYIIGWILVVISIIILGYGIWALLTQMRMAQQA